MMEVKFTQGQFKRDHHYFRVTVKGSKIRYLCYIKPWDNTVYWQSGRHPDFNQIKLINPAIKWFVTDIESMGCFAYNTSEFTIFKIKSKSGRIYYRLEPSISTPENTKILNDMLDSGEHDPEIISAIQRSQVAAGYKASSNCTLKRFVHRLRIREC